MRKRHGGFTLLELIVVVIIIGILASLGIPLYMKTLESAKWEEAATTIKAIKESEARYSMETGNFFNVAATDNYAAAAGELDISWNTRYWDFTADNSAPGYCNIIATRKDGTEAGANVTLTITNTNLQGTWTGNHSATPSI